MKGWLVSITEPSIVAIAYGTLQALPENRRT
jgi:hypothetical protein